MMNKLVPVVFIFLTVGAVVCGAADAPAGVVNINTADAEQLQLLPRVGPALSQRIVEFRSQNGDFAAVEELVAVKGIGEASLDRLRPYVVVKGDTTLTTKISLPRVAKDAKNAAATS